MDNNLIMIYNTTWLVADHIGPAEIRLPGTPTQLQVIVGWSFFSSGFDDGWLLSHDTQPLEGGR